MDSRRIERAAAAWLARRDAPGWSGADAARLQVWLDRATAHRIAFLRLEAAWNEAGRLKALGAGLPAGQVPVRGCWWPPMSVPVAATASSPPPPATGRSDGRALDGLVFAPRPAAPRRRPWFAAVAAALLLGVGLGIGGGWYRSVEPVDYLSPVGEVAPFTLGDGSLAVLGSDTRIAVRLSSRQRAVALEHGEAIFEVRHEPQRPFVVAAGERQVVAVGTRFSVRREGEAVRVVVTEGAVRLEPAGRRGGPPGAAVLLDAGSIALAGPDGVSVQRPGLEAVARRLAWRDGDLSFEDLSLAEAVAEFNRYNARQLVLADPAVAALRVGGSFRWSEPERFVDLLELAFPVRAERSPDRVLLHHR